MLSRTELEGLAIEGYRSGRLSEEQVRRLLSLGNRFAVHAFLKERGVRLNYSEKDLKHDLQVSDAWLASRITP